MTPADSPRPPPKPRRQRPPGKLPPLTDAELARVRGEIAREVFGEWSEAIWQRLVRGHGRT